MTWLRNHKRANFETSVNDAANEFKDEPDWLVGQILKRKREEVLKRWEEREAHLRQIRTKERSLEDRGAKRRRVDEGHGRSTAKSTKDDEDDEWLLADADDESTSEDTSSHFSKETRDLMKRLGMGGSRVPNEEESDGDVQGNEIKVRRVDLRYPLQVIPVACCSTLTFKDLFYIQDPLAIDTIRIRAEATSIPLIPPRRLNKPCRHRYR